MKVQIINDENYSALYIDGVLAFDGHTLYASDVAEAILGAANVNVVNCDDIEDLEYDDDGNSFVDGVMIWENGRGFVKNYPFEID